MSKSSTIGLKHSPIFGLFTPRWEITGEIKSGSMVLAGGDREMRRRTLTFSDFLSLLFPHTHIHTYQDLFTLSYGQSMHVIALVNVL